MITLTLYSERSSVKLTELRVRDPPTIYTHTQNTHFHCLRQTLSRARQVYLLRTHTLLCRAPLLATVTFNWTLQRMKTLNSWDFFILWRSRDCPSLFNGSQVVVAGNADIYSDHLLQAGEDKDK